ncbi:MAG: diacylglycerol kinase family protein [Phormidesmis sp.]
MFSRDSQASRDRKTSPANVLPLRTEKTGTEKTGTEKTSTEAANVETVTNETIERSQSWQIAPNLFTSFRYAWAGISYAFRTQRNFRIHSGIGALAMFLCWTLKVSNLEIAVVCLTIGAVLVMEILNTALESLVDLTVGQNYHALAKVAKDCAAGAVLMAAIVALIIAVLVFAPPLWAILGPMIPSVLSI